MLLLVRRRLKAPRVGENQMLDPVGMPESIAAADEAAETVTEQNHLRNVHGLAPPLEKPHVLLLDLLRIM